eukprot:PhM_4_TR2345/c0_g1_i1/m.3216
MFPRTIMLRCHSGSGSSLLLAEQLKQRLEHLENTSPESSSPLLRSTGGASRKIVTLIGVVSKVSCGLLGNDEAKPCAEVHVATSSFAGASSSSSSSLPNSEKDVHVVRWYGRGAVQMASRHLRVGSTVVWVHGDLNRHVSYNATTRTITQFPTVHVVPNRGTLRILKQ